MMSVMLRKFPLTEMVMPSNKKPQWGPGPPASQAPPSSAEGGKSSRSQPCCCCPVTVQKEQQGIFRYRAGVGGQGSHEAMESPQALMCPLEKGVRGIETSGLCRWLAFAAFLCWLKWNFCTRDWFFAPTRQQNVFLVRERCRCYEKDTGLRRLLRILLYLLAVVFPNQWAYRQSCKRTCNLLNYKLLYGFKPVSQYAHSHKKTGGWAYLHSTPNRYNQFDISLLCGYS